VYFRPETIKDLPVRFCSGLLVLLLTFATQAIAGELTAQEQRGKQLYTRGESASGAPVTAIMSRGATPIPGSILPCVGCHGDDGKGRPEGGVVPPDITWASLSATHGHNHSYGRTHPAFDESMLGYAISKGIDPGDNALGAAMPRYQMSDADLQDLIAYLKRIEEDLDPGLSDDKIRIGILWPRTGAAGSQGQAMKQVLESFFDDINARGGIHGRQIELIDGRYKQDPMRAAWEARDFLDERAVFAMVSGYLSGVEQPITALADELRVPLVGPYTPLPQDETGLQRFTFYLAGGIVQQAIVLATSRQAQQEKPEASLAIVHPQGAVYDAAVQAVQRAIGRTRKEDAFILSYQLPYFDAIDFAETLGKKGIRRVLFFGTAGDLKRLAAASADRGWSPDLLLPGVYASGGLFEFPASFQGRVFVGYSTLPADHTPRGIELFEKLHADHGIGYQHSTQQISAYVAAMVLAEGIKRAGRELNREKLVQALEGLTDFQTGLMPPISYSRSRRIGARGGYVVEVDLEQNKFGAASKWIELQP
jgi:ABC-type branched-subunit amino acid transport system substrate-binding protein